MPQNKTKGGFNVFVDFSHSASVESVSSVFEFVSKKIKYKRVIHPLCSANNEVVLRTD